MSNVIGYWCKTWDVSAAPAGANLGLAFSGWVLADDVLPPANAIKDKLEGEAWISLGGGNENGSFSADKLTSLLASVKAGAFGGWAGIAADVEVCDGSGLSPAFAALFAAIKARGLKVMVTISHSAPYDCSDRVALMDGFFADDNIDYLSPQLYTTGEETQNDYADPSVPWADYSTAKAAIVPSIVQASMYEDAKAYFATQGVTLGGFVQWA